MIRISHNLVLVWLLEDYRFRILSLVRRNRRYILVLETLRVQCIIGSEWVWVCHLPLSPFNWPHVTSNFRLDTTIKFLWANSDHLLGNCVLLNVHDRPIENWSGFEFLIFSVPSLFSHSPQPGLKVFCLILSHRASNILGNPFWR